MRSEKRYNLAQNAGFNNARTSDDRRAYRAIMKQFSNELANAGAAFCSVAARQRTYLDALLKHGNKAASFPSPAEWFAALSKAGAA